MSALLAAVAAAGVTTLLLTPVARRLAIWSGYLDVPNDRSSHDRPTPRNGGYAILAGIGAGVVASGAWQAWTASLLLAAALMLAAIAFIDERRALPHFLRLVLQFVVAGALVWHWTTTDAFVVTFSPLAAWLAGAAALVWLVGVINAYNFMDGLNGIAGLAALVTGAVMAALAVRGGDLVAAPIAASVAAAAAGFLPFNLRSGSIFMGDSGSTTFGLILGALVLQIDRPGPVPVAAALPLTPFVLDAGVTLLRRALRGERFFSTPHSSHYYQRLQKQGWSHAAVALLYGGLTAASAAVSLSYDGLGTRGRVAAVVALASVHVVVVGLIHARWSAHVRHSAVQN